MLKPILAAAALIASTLPALAQAGGDPTFNGLVARATCYIRNVTDCRSASCEQVARNCQGDLCGTLSLFPKTHEYSLTSGPKKPLRVEEISPAEVGKPLWVKFQFDTATGVGDGRLTIRPDRVGGGYETTASVYLGSSTDPSGRSFSLINMECDRLSDDP